ncbi:MAG: twin-arginine translocase subunit TatC, partial [Planctomycetes bacterium]|nr:twin-arginine translocase subunit TatC [Planctomycetota bacterium]
EYLDEAEKELPRMSFGDHLDELRTRLIRSLIAVFAAILVVLPFKDQVEGIVTEPYRVQWRIGFDDWVAQLEAKEKAGMFEGEKPVDRFGKGYLTFCRENREEILAGEFPYPAQIVALSGYPVPYTLAAIGGLEDMWMYMMAALIFALTLAAPVVAWQAWAFVAAGLYPKERKLFYRYFPFMAGLSVAGVLFGYFVALPYTLGFLISLMNPEQVGAMLSVGQYFTLLFAMTAAMGVVFQLPTVMVALQRVGLVHHSAYVKHWRITVLVIFFSAAVFTPPDPVSMLLVSAPMVVLYLLGLVLTFLWRKNEAPVIEVAEGA